MVMHHKRELTQTVVGWPPAPTCGRACRGAGHLDVPIDEMVSLPFVPPRYYFLDLCLLVLYS